MTDEELSQLNPQQCIAACEQIDQNIVALLQRIDEKFVSATRTVTDRLIPAVEDYGRSSKQTWDSVKVKLWQPTGLCMRFYMI